MSQFPSVLKPSEEDVAKMLACKVHLGTRNCTKEMETYVWKRRSDGVHIFDLAKTWEKLQLAARVLAGLDNPSEVVVISARPYGQRAVLKFSKFTQTKAISGRFTPGTFTNQITPRYIEPSVLVVTDPKTDHQPILETSYINAPVIAFCDTDSSLCHVDIAIPCNNKAKHAIGLMWYFLAREYLRFKDPKNYPRSQEWDVMPDLFFYRDPEEEKAHEEFQQTQNDYDDANDYDDTNDNNDNGENWEDGQWSNNNGGGDNNYDGGNNNGGGNNESQTSAAGNPSWNETMAVSNDWDNNNEN